MQIILLGQFRLNAGLMPMQHWSVAVACRKRHLSAGIASTGTSAPIAVETYSSADGTISLPLQFGMYDVLITPLSDVIAPLRLARGHLGDDD
ncbi:MAG: hypothetical protein V9G23_13870 [Giesbergeria sp.]